MQHSANRPNQPSTATKTPKRAGRMRGLIAAAIVTLGAAGGTAAVLAAQSEPAKPETGSASFKPAGDGGGFRITAWKPR